MTPHAKHTPLDSLRFMVASDPIGTALEHIDDDAHDVAIAMLETLRKELRYEAKLHGIEGSSHYSNGLPVFAEGEYVTTERRPDGTAAIVTLPAIYCPYPADGGKAHPVCRPDEGPAA